MKRLFYILLLMMTTGTAMGQQLPMYTQNMNNPLVSNPAIAGSEKYTSLRFTSRQQWAGIDGITTPGTQILSVHSRIGQSNFYDRRGMVNKATEFDEKGNIVQRKGLIFSGKEAIGGIVFNDRNGPLSKTGVQLAYSYHIPLDQWRNRFNQAPMLSFGLSASFTQMTFDQSKLELYDQNDPIISGAKESYFIPDINFGMYLYTKEYYAGLSAMNIIQPRVKVEGSDSKDNKLVRHFFAMAGYKYETYQEWIIEPMVFVRASQYVPVQFEVSGRMHIKTLNFGLGYRSNNDICLLFGMKVGRYYMAYSFDYSFDNIIQYSSGSHEIVLGYNFGESVLRGYRGNK